MKRFNRIFCLLIAVSIFAVLFVGCEYGSKENGQQKQNYDKNNPGEIYYQEVDPDHIAESDEGIKYADNEILIVVKDGTPKSDIEKLAKKYDAEIVGYIEQTGDYQLKLSEAMSIDELDSVAEKLKKEQNIESAYINYISEYSESAVSNFNYGEKWEKDLENFNNCKGKSWGFEAIETPAAWDLLSLNKNKVNEIRVGLIDGGFDTSHEDLEFEEVFYNYETSDHGTHVAGTMAAKANNSKGICGVYPYGDDNLYGVSYIGASTHLKNGNLLYSSMILKISYAELILRNVKVINSSLGFNYNIPSNWGGTAFPNSGDRWEKRKKFLEKNSYVLGDFLKRMLNKGYDFVLVNAAGNDSEISNNIIYDSKYSWWLNVIDESDYPDVYDRIIVVGAVNSSFEISDYSNGGDRVDIYAPGGESNLTKEGNMIYSSVSSSSYDYMVGTSMAAPHVSGVAAMVWSANNSLTGADVKNVICSSKSLRCTSSNMIDAYIAVEKAFITDSDDSQTTPKDGAILSYVVKSENEERIPNAKVVATSDTTNEEFSANTDFDGHFELIVPDGTYSLKVTADGYDDYVLKKVQAASGEVNYIDWIKMSPVITSFTIPSDMVLTLGETGVIEPENIEPSGASTHNIKWSSSDESVATVTPKGEKCIITGKAKGNVVVTASIDSGGKTITKTTQLRVASKARDTVLVLDVSGSMGGTPLEEMKKAAKQFCEELLTDEFNNRVGLVLYDSDIETYDLTNDVTALESYINNIDDGGSTNMEGGIINAVEMLDGLGAKDSIKNIVIMADGLPNKGNTSESGSMPVSSSYSFYSTDISYANAVIDTAQSAMFKYNLYSLGFFHDLYGEEKDFAVTLMQSLTNMNDGYHEVDQAENLQFAFGDISEEISDGSKIVINIACPVDVSVSYQGETLSSSQSNYNDKTSFGSLQLLGKNQDVKVVSVDADKVYDISLSGTDEGAMDYSVNYFDDTENLIDSRSFTNIPITNTTKISSSTENSAEVSLNLDSDGDGVSDIIYSATQNSVGSVTWEREPETEPTTELTTEYIEPSTEAIQSAYKSSLETWQIILLVLGITVAIGVVIVAVVLVVTKDKTDDLYNLPVDPVIPDSKSNNDNESEPLETKPLTSKSATIRILSGPMKGKEFTLSFDENVLIGKKAGLTKVLLSNDYEMVSRVHCTISYSEKLNKFFVTDSSKNGTYYENHIRLVKGKRTPLVPGSIILLADDNCRILLK